MHFISVLSFVELQVMSPLKKPDPAILDDTDLAGPIVFAVMMGTFLLLTGKVPILCCSSTRN